MFQKNHSRLFVPSSWNLERQIEAAMEKCDRDRRQMTLIEAIQAAQKADDAWHAALVKAYGCKAGDARYDVRGVATSELEALYRAKVDADVVRWKATFPDK